MTDKTLLKEYKSTISDLTKEKQELNETIVQKDSKIKQILIQLEQANSDIQSMGSKIGELQEKLNKKQTIKLNIDKKIEEILENKIESSVDTDDEK
jgi:chromosome segregation ATPase